MLNLFIKKKKYTSHEIQNEMLLLKYFNQKIAEKHLSLCILTLSFIKVKKLWNQNSFVKANLTLHYKA